jgi:hypothetical protein
MSCPFKRQSTRLEPSPPVASTQDTRSINGSFGGKSRPLPSTSTQQLTLSGMRIAERHVPQPSFQRFGALPIELRIKIWREVCHVPRAVEIIRCDEKERRKLPYKTPPPAVLHVNQEARREGLKYYKTFFSSKDYPTYETYINWKVDYLFLQIKPYNEFTDLIPAPTSFDYMEIRKCPRIAILAMDIDWFFKWLLRGDRLVANPVELEELRERLESLVIIKNGNPAYYEGVGTGMVLRDEDSIEETDSRNVISDLRLLRTVPFPIPKLDADKHTPESIKKIRKLLSRAEIRLGRVEWQSEDQS